MRQLPLAVGLHPAATFDVFHPGDNAAPVAHLRGLACDGSGAKPAQVYLWGPPGAGKTHLLQACCHLCATRGQRAVYVSLDALGNHAEEAMAGLETLSMVCVDDLEGIAGRRERETAVFSLINACRSSGTTLVFGAGCSPSGLGIGLPDLASRLVWGAVYRVRPLDDGGKLVALENHARQRGFDLSREVGAYLLNHCSRDMIGLMRLVERLDRGSLAAKRRITIPFIKTLLQ
ncbi:MAG: DnaA regulatory inactivator Hda [Pseudomonadota bacterium]|nr:DnaA regulatory inactivator Hda [Pseudomonadota bacterium]